MHSKKSYVKVQLALNIYEINPFFFFFFQWSPKTMAHYYLKKMEFNQPCGNNCRQYAISLFVD